MASWPDEGDVATRNLQRQINIIMAIDMIYLVIYIYI